MSSPGVWIANCRPDRVSRVAAASVFRLDVGPPRPNQLQTLEGLLAEGMVGLYRVGKKGEQEAQVDQQAYLSQSEFLPSPDSLRGLLGSLGPDHPR